MPSFFLDTDDADKNLSCGLCHIKELKEGIGSDEPKESKPIPVTGFLLCTDASSYESLHGSTQNVADMKAVVFGCFCQFLPEIVGYGADEMNG